MEVIRRNTDYALRAILNLADNYNNGNLSTRVIADTQQVPYPLACKLMQKLQKSRLVKSSPGPLGGYRLAKPPGKISIFDIVKAIQGPVQVNLCLTKDFSCQLSRTCPLQPKLRGLQKSINKHLKEMTLLDVIKGRKSTRKADG